MWRILPSPADCVAVLSLSLCSSQLSRLRKSYEKLQKKQLREARGEANKGQGEDQFEISRLTRKLEVWSEKTC